jgi:hypothetical protein
MIMFIVVGLYVEIHVPDEFPLHPDPYLFHDHPLKHVGPLYLEDSGLRYWGADNFFTGGTTFSITSVPIANTLDDTVYQSIRLGTFSYWQKLD